MQIENNENPQQPRKSQSMFKTLLLTALSVLTVFIVWLFYPLSSPPKALRVYLPEGNRVTIESHDFSVFLQDLQKKDFIVKFLQLPVVKEIIKQNKIENVFELAEDFSDKADTYRPAYKRILAFSGAYYENEDFCLIMSVDNIGYLSAKLLQLYFPAIKISGESYSVVPLKKYHKAAKYDELYLTMFKGRRLIAISSSKKLLAKINIENSTKVKSIFYAKSEHGVEVTGNCKTGSKQINSNPQNLHARIFGKTYRISRLKTHAYFCWQGEDFYGDIKLEAGKKYLPKLSYLSGDAIFPPEQKGLGITVNVSPKDARALFAALSAAEVKFRSVAKYMQKNFDGKIYGGFYPRAPQVSGALGVYYSVNNRNEAAKESFGALSGFHKNLLSNNGNIMSKLLFVGAKPYRGRGSKVVLPLPFMSNRNSVTSSFKTIGNIDFGVLSIGEDAIPEPILSTGNIGESLGRLNANWKYSEDVLTLMDALYGRDLVSLLALFSVKNSGLDDFMNSVRMTRKAFESMKWAKIDFILTQQTGNYVISGRYSGKLRIK